MAGYNWNKGKSNNAVNAENDGATTKTGITQAWVKANGINEKVGFIKWLVKHDLISASEWHHTSKMFNESDYYRPEDVREQLADLEQLGTLAVYKAIYADKTKRNSYDRYEIHMEALNGLS